MAAIFNPVAGSGSDVREQITTRCSFQSIDVEYF